MNDIAIALGRGFSAMGVRLAGRALLLLAAALISAVHSPPPPPPVIYIVRHGEKNWGLGCLSAAGQARANNLVRVFDGQLSPRHETFRTPDAIFANLYDDPIDCERCIETVTPIAQNLSLSVNSSFGFEYYVSGNTGSAAAFMAKLRSLVTDTASCQAAAASACGAQLGPQCEVCTGRQQHALRTAHCTAR